MKEHINDCQNNRKIQLDFVGFATLLGPSDLLCSVPLTCSCSGERPRSFEDRTTGEVTQELFGDVADDNLNDAVFAAARVIFAPEDPDGAESACSATLVRPDKLLTAAHCLCDRIPSGSRAVFADMDGDIQPDAPRFPVESWELPPEATNFGAEERLCRQPFDGLGDGDAKEWSAWDLAVLTIRPSSTTRNLPNITPVPPSLNRLVLGGRAMPFLQDEVWAVGYGANAPLSFLPDPTSCPNCGTRLSGELADVQVSTDPCNRPLTEFDCWNGELLTAPAIETGNTLEASSGDSGGGLFFNVGGPAPVVGGVHSHWQDTPERRTRWAPTPSSADFLWEALELPFTLSLEQQMQDTAIFARLGQIRINDRANVAVDAVGDIGARVVTNLGLIRVGPDAFVGELRSRGNILVKDRAEVDGDARSFSSVSVPDSATVQGFTRAGEFHRFELFDLTIPWDSAGNDLQEIPNDTDASLGPGRHSALTIRSRATLTISHGVYVLEELHVEPEASLIVDSSSGPVWIYVTGSTGPRFEGVLEGNPEDIFVGVVNASDVFLGNQWRGTLVAPQAKVNASMVPGAKLIGSFFVNGFELHQGRFLEQRSFSGPWVPVCEDDFRMCE